MNKKWIVVLLGILLVGAGLAYWNQKKKEAKGAQDSRQTVQATLGTIQDTVEATGEVQPLNRVEIKPPIAGRIEKLLVIEGDHVRGGDILGWMSSTDRAAILDAARAKGADELNHWQDAYKATPIIAPLSGSIILKNVVVGQTVDASTVLYAMSDKLIVLADTDETDIGRVKIGMPAVITLDAYPTSPIEGSVFQVLYEGKNVSNVITYGVKILPKTVPLFFRSQMTANISLISKKKENVVVLPASAIRTVAGGEHEVLVPGPDGKPVHQPVETGLENGDSVEIVDGLKAGDSVLVTTKKYSPQHAASSSPLVMGGPRQGGQQNLGQPNGKKGR